jgi:hypothetical protein
VVRFGEGGCSVRTVRRRGFGGEAPEREWVEPRVRSLRQSGLYRPRRVEPRGAIRLRLSAHQPLAFDYDVDSINVVQFNPETMTQLRSFALKTSLPSIRANASDQTPQRRREHGRKKTLNV